MLHTLHTINTFAENSLIHVHKCLRRAQKRWEDKTLVYILTQIESDGQHHLKVMTKIYFPANICQNRQIWLT